MHETCNLFFGRRRLTDWDLERKEQEGKITPFIFILLFAHLVMIMFHQHLQLPKYLGTSVVSARIYAGHFYKKYQFVRLTQYHTLCLHKTNSKNDISQKAGKIVKIKFRIRYSQCQVNGWQLTIHISRRFYGSLRASVNKVGTLTCLWYWFGLNFIQIKMTIHILYNIKSTCM